MFILAYFFLVIFILMTLANYLLYRELSAWNKQSSDD